MLKNVCKEVKYHETALKESKKLTDKQEILLAITETKIKRGVGDYKGIKGVSQMKEIRLTAGSGWRTYFTETETYFIIWAFGIKNTQTRDIEKAKKRYKADGFN